MPDGVGWAATETERALAPAASGGDVHSDPRLVDRDSATESAPRRRLGGSGGTGGTAGAGVVWTLAGLAVVVGIALRAWSVSHFPTTSDEAVVGLMAQQILHGHFSAFYWGQPYGGVEPYVIAPAFAVFGSSSWLLHLVPTLLAAGSGLLTWRIARRLVADPALAALAGAISWAVPEFSMRTSTYEWGFRGVALFCGLLLILVSLRVLDGHRRPWDFAELGLAFGVGFWSSPEVAYFVLPALVLVLQSLWADTGSRKVVRWTGNILVVVLAATLGALPWIWANVRSGLASIGPNAIHLAPGSPDFASRLHLFFEYSSGLLLSLRAVDNGNWLLAEPVAVAVELVIVTLLAVSVVLCVLRGGRSLALASGVVAFPFLVAFSPATWYWEDGRYIGYGVPLLVLVMTMGCTEAARRLYRGRRQGGRAERRMGRRLMAGVGAGLVALTVANFAVFAGSFFKGWGNPDGPTLAALSKLESGRVDDGYADYWVAYRLDFLSGGSLHVTVVGTDPDRWMALNHQVAESRAPAWIFVPDTPLGASQFDNAPQIVGPGNVNEAQFIADLHRFHIGYRTVTAGLVNAVIPDRPVSPYSVGVRNTVARGRG